MFVNDKSRARWGSGGDEEVFSGGVQGCWYKVAGTRLLVQGERTAGLVPTQASAIFPFPQTVWKPEEAGSSTAWMVNRIESTVGNPAKGWGRTERGGPG